MVNTQLLRVQNVHTKILQIFSRVFEFALAEFARNTRKLMYREYFHFYSTSIEILSVCKRLIPTIFDIFSSSLKVWPGPTAFPDWFHPNTTNWWQSLAQEFHDKIKFDGMWLVGLLIRQKKKNVMLPSPDQNLKIGSVGRDFFFFTYRERVEFSNIFF